MQKNVYYFTLFIFVGFSLLYFVGTGRFDLLGALIVCLAIHDWYSEAFFEWTGIIASTLYGIHLLLYKLGYIKEFVSSIERLTVEGMTYRLALGFDHPNFTAAFILCIVAAAIGCTRQQYKAAFGCIALIYALISYSYTNSRTALYAVVLSLVLLIISIFVHNRHIYWAFPLAVLISIGYQLYLSLSFHDDGAVNFRWSQRPGIMYNYLVTEGVHLLPNPDVKELITGGASIDSFWFNLIFCAGLLIAVGIFILLFTLCRYTSLHGYTNITFITISYMIYGFSENHVLDFGYGILTILIFMPVIYPTFFADNMRRRFNQTVSVPTQ